MILLIILGMALVTALPRVMPAMIVDKLIFPVWVNRWLEAIPYAALGALIFPAILSVKEGEPHVGLIGGLVAVFLALFRLNIIIVVIGAFVSGYIFFYYYYDILYFTSLFYLYKHINTSTILIIQFIMNKYNKSSHITYDSIVNENIKVARKSE